MESMDGAVDSIAGFQRAMAVLIHEAQANGVDVEGAWDFREGFDPSYGVEIFEVQ